MSRTPPELLHTTSTTDELVESPQPESPQPESLQPESPQRESRQPASPAHLPAGPDCRCDNCGAPAPGRFCGTCGQRVEHSVHSIWHFAREAVEDLTHADSRVWQTFAALLFRPGFLTVEYLAGRRARYLPPLRLYLVLSVVFFLIAAAGTHQESALQISLDSPPAGAPASSGPPFRRDAACGHTSYAGPGSQLLHNLLDTGCRKFRQDGGRSLGAAFLHNIPRAMFVFLPLLALVMSLMYWWPRRFYVEHLLFLVHDQAFVFLWFSVLWLVSLALPESASDILALSSCLYIPYYLFKSMRRVYPQGRMLTLLKFAVLAVAYFVASMLMLASIMVYSVLTA